MNKTETFMKPYFIDYFKHIDNRKAVEGFTGSFQKALDDYYLSICGTAWTQP